MKRSCVDVIAAAFEVGLELAIGFCALVHRDMSIGPQELGQRLLASRQLVVKDADFVAAGSSPLIGDEVNVGNVGAIESCIREVAANN